MVATALKPCRSSGQLGRIDNRPYQVLGESAVATRDAIVRHGHFERTPVDMSGLLVLQAAAHNDDGPLPYTMMTARRRGNARRRRICVQAGGRANLRTRPYIRHRPRALCCVLWCAATLLRPRWDAWRLRCRESIRAGCLPGVRTRTRAKVERSGRTQCGVAVLLATSAAASRSSNVTGTHSLPTSVCTSVVSVWPHSRSHHKLGWAARAGLPPGCSGGQPRVLANKLSRAARVVPP